MNDLFSADGLAALSRLSSLATLYAFDFDGTLAPIVEHPDDAAAAPRTVALLERLGALVPTALVTGRSADDLRRRIPFTPLHLIGNHGSEGLPDAWHAALADAVSAHGEIVQRWLAQWPELIRSDDPGIVVEPKRYSISLHYRQAADQDAAARSIGAAIARLDPPPCVIGGKCVFNLLPEGAPDKGSALRALVRFEDCEAAFFVGDDLTDEAAFENAPDSWVTVRVGPVAHSAARYSLSAQADIDRCLEQLVALAEAAAKRQR